MNVLIFGSKSPTPKKEALELATQLVDSLRPVSTRIALAGSLLRNHDIVGDLDIVVVPTKSITTLPVKIPMAVNLFVTTAECFEPCFLHYAIGKAIIHLKATAKSKGMKLDQECLWIPEKMGIENSRYITDISLIYKELGQQAPKWLLDAVKDPTGLYVRR